LPPTIVLVFQFQKTYNEKKLVAKSLFRSLSLSPPRTLNNFFVGFFIEASDQPKITTANSPQKNQSLREGNVRRGEK
jgi:hypothetical protein